MLEVMDWMFEDDAMVWGTRCQWDVDEDEHEVRMRLDMPGLSKEDMKVSVEDDDLAIRGRHLEEGGRAQEEEMYETRLELPDD